MADSQPARKSYFFDKGYKDLRRTVAGAWARNLEVVRDFWQNISDLEDEEIIPRAFQTVVYFFAIIAVLAIGSVLTALLTLANVIVLVVVMAVVYIAFTVVWAVDRLYLVCNGIFSACINCKTRSIIPHYRCPSCNALHTNLTPGVYGILSRRCNCGNKLPTTFVGRRKLQAFCTNPDCGEELLDRGARPFCVPVVGGRSVGKTAFITAFSREFIETVAPEKEIETRFYNDKMEDLYREITRDFTSGSTRMTERSHDINTASSISFSFFAEHARLRVKRLIHLYDVAGEVFMDNAEHEKQEQYRYCHGIVMIIDPFSIPLIFERYADQLTPEDIAGIGRADLNDIADSFINKLRTVTGMGDRDMSRVPLAVVISKIDSAGLEQEVGAEAVCALMRAEPERFPNYFDAQDYLCRKLLWENDMGGFLNSMTSRFQKTRFFACSAIGHTRDQGEYMPYGVQPPMEWLCLNADKRLARTWTSHTFTKEPAAVREE